MLDVIKVVRWTHVVIQLKKDSEVRQRKTLRTPAQDHLGHVTRKALLR